MTEEEIQKKHASAFATLDAQLEQLEAAIQETPFLSGNLQHVIVHALALRMLEFARGCKTLARSGLAAANASLGRQCLEVGFKLKAVSGGAVSANCYLEQEIITRGNSLKRVLDLPAAASLLDVDSLAEYRQEYREYQDRKKSLSGEISIRKWAEHAQEVEVYVFAYSALSDHVHTGAGSLEHITAVTATGQVFMQTGPSDYLLHAVLEGVCHCLASSSTAIRNMNAPAGISTQDVTSPTQS